MTVESVLPIELEITAHVATHSGFTYTVRAGKGRVEVKLNTAISGYTGVAYDGEEVWKGGWNLNHTANLALLLEGLGASGEEAARCVESACRYVEVMREVTRTDETTKKMHADAIEKGNAVGRARMATKMAKVAASGAAWNAWRVKAESLADSKLWAEAMHNVPALPTAVMWWADNESENGKYGVYECREDGEHGKTITVVDSPEKAAKLVEEHNAPFLGLAVRKSAGGAS